MSKRLDVPAVFYPSVRIPKVVRVDGYFLKWEDSEPKQAQWRRPTDRTLIEFSKLSDAPEGVVCDFAKRYGVLRAFKLKRKYQEPTDIELPDGSVWGIGNIDAGSGSEPIALWIFLAKRLRAILRISSKLKGPREGKPRKPAPGSDEDWKTLDPESDNPPIEDPQDAQFFLCHVINEWLVTSSVRLELGIAEWSREATAWKLAIAYNGLMGGLAYRLLLTVMGESNLYACDGCGCPYIRTKRAPRPGQENFCDDCTAIARRRASQRWKEKNR